MVTVTNDSINPYKGSNGHLIIREKKIETQEQIYQTFGKKQNRLGILLGGSILLTELDDFLKNYSKQKEKIYCEK